MLTLLFAPGFASHDLQKASDQNPHECRVNEGAAHVNTVNDELVTSSHSISNMTTAYFDLRQTCRRVKGL